MERRDVKKDTELIASVPSPSDYSVSSDLWAALESEIQKVSTHIKNGDELVPNDVANVRKLKTQVDSYVTAFVRAMNNAQSQYKKLVERKLVELGFNEIEDFVAKKRKEQSAIQDARIAEKMDNLKTISDGLLKQTERLKDVPMSKELLPAFTARFPKVQSGAKTNGIKDWAPYFAIMSRTVMVMDAFFKDPKYEDAVLLPLYSETIRELLAYAKDGKEEHLANVPVKFQQDQHLIREAKLKQSLNSKADGIEHIRQVLLNVDNMDDLSETVRTIRMEEAWEQISQIVRLVNMK